MKYIINLNNVKYIINLNNIYNYSKKFINSRNLYFILYLYNNHNFIKFLYKIKYKNIFSFNNKFLKLNNIFKIYNNKIYYKNNFIYKNLNILLNYNNILLNKSKIKILNNKFIILNKNKNNNKIYSNSILYNQLYIHKKINKISKKINKFSNYNNKNYNNIIKKINIIEDLLNLKEINCNKTNLISNNNLFYYNNYLFDLIFNFNKNKLNYYIKFNLINKFELINSNYYIEFNKFDLNEYLNKNFKNYKYFKNNYKSVNNSFINSYYILINSFYNQYKKQNIILNLKNFELIIKKTINYIKINNKGSSNYNINDILNLKIINLINYIYKKNNLKVIIYYPILLNFKKLSKYKTSNLCSISFHNTLKFIINNSINKQYDWIKDIKSNIISNNLVPFSNNWINKFKI